MEYLQHTIIGNRIIFTLLIILAMQGFSQLRVRLCPGKQDQVRGVGASSGLDTPPSREGEWRARQKRGWRKGSSLSGEGRLCQHPSPVPHPKLFPVFSWDSSSRNLLPRFQRKMTESLLQRSEEAKAPVPLGPPTLQPVPQSRPLPTCPAVLLLRQAWSCCIQALEGLESQCDLAQLARASHVTENKTEPRKDKVAAEAGEG